MAEKSQKEIIDLSARGGLGSMFFGDTDQVTPTPNTRYLVDETQLASGTFNPFTRYGYLSPSVNTFHAVTLDQTLNAVMGSQVYDIINDDLYLAERGTQLFKGDGLDDVSLTRQLNLSTTGSVLHDLEIYMVNGERKLFYIYRAKTAVANYVLTTNFSAAVDGASINGRINPAGSAEPTLIYSARNVSSGAGTGQTFSITVPAGTNKAMMLITATYNDGAATDCTATFDGDAMTSVTSGSGGNVGTDFRFNLFKFAAPGAKTGNIVITWNASVTLRIAHLLVFDGADQTTPIAATGFDTSTAAASISGTVEISAEYQLPFASVFSDAANHSLVTGQTEVFNSTNGTGNDSFGYFSMDTARLRAGIADLPFASNDNDWLTSTATGSFLAATTSNYNFMRIADNGFGYIFADNAVHKVDGTVSGGTNGTLSESVLVFPEFFRLTDAIDYRGLMYIVIHQNLTDTTATTQTNFTTPCGIYLWDRLTTIVRMADYVPVEGVRVIQRVYISPGGSIRIMCVSSNGMTQIRELRGSTFEVVRELGIGAYPQYVDSLAVAGDKTVWECPDGSIYCHGKVTATSPSEILARIARVRDPQAETTSGLAQNITGGAIVFGSGSSSGTTGYRNDRQGLTISYSDGTPVVKKVYPFDVMPVASTDQIPNVGDVYSGVHRLPVFAEVNYVRIFNLPITTANTTTVATVKTYYNHSATASESIAVTKADAALGYKYLPGKPDVFAVQIEIEWNIAVALGTDHYLPIYAEIDYTPSEKRR